MDNFIESYEANAAQAFFQDQLRKTKHAMNMKNMTSETFYALKNGMKINHLNPRLHHKMKYYILKNSNKLLAQFSYHDTKATKFPRYAVSLKKQKAIRKIGNLPVELIRIINEYAFERIEEVCYSLFHLSIDIYPVFLLNISIMNSVTRKNYENSNEEQKEEWVWTFFMTQLRASNCRVCGNYKKTATPNISPRVVCHCVDNINNVNIINNVNSVNIVNIINIVNVVDIVDIVDTVDVLDVVV